MIDIIELPELIALGIEVEVPWNELSRAVPAAWERLFAAETGAASFLEVSISREHGVYRELVGFLAASTIEIPEGMSQLVIPPQRYIRIIHDGPLAGIADGFAKLYDYAAKSGLRATDFKLDFGYLPSLPGGRHELHVALEAERLLLGG